MPRRSRVEARGGGLYRVHFLGGGYTYLAIVPDVHAIANPPNTKTRVSSLLRSLVAVIPKSTAHTTAKPMLYVQ